METLKKVWAEYLEKNSDMKYNTKEAYRRAWEKLISAIGNKYVFEVNSKHIEHFRAWLFQRTDSPKSVDTIMRNASPIMSWAVFSGYRKGNPFKGVRKPKIPEKEIKVYSEAELFAMLRCANLLWRAKIVTAASAGLRVSEIQNLRWQDVDFDNEYITIQSREGSKDNWPWSTKSSKSRQVPLSKQLELLYTQLYEKLPEGYSYVMIPGKRQFNLQHKRYLLQQQNKELPERLCHMPDPCNRRWYTILRRARIWDKKFHDLRSTAITNWILSGLTPQEVQKLAGHESIEVTMRYYAACRQNFVQKAKLTVGATGLEPATS